MLNRFADNYNALVLGSPRIVLALLALLFVFFAYHTKDFKLDASADSLLLENDKDLRVFREVNDRYETKEFLFVTFTPDEDLFSDVSLQHIKDLREELRQLERVDSIVSLLDVPLLKIIGGKLSEVVKNYRTLEDDSIDRQRAKQELIGSPIFSELVISKDGQTTALLVNMKINHEYLTLQKKKNRLLLKKQFEGIDEDERQLLKQTLEKYDVVKTEVDSLNHEHIVQIREIIKKYKEFGVVHLGGIPMIADDMITFIRNDLIIFGAGVFIFLVCMLSIIFRQARWVVLPLLSCAFAGLIMIGLLGLIGWRVTVISSNFISLMLILTMSMNVHLVVRYRQLRRDFPDWEHRQLVFETTKKMVQPCLYTSLTTMMGFGSLVVSGIKPVIDFGWMMTLGLIVTFLTSFTLFPAVFVMLGKSSNIKPERAEIPFTAALASFTERHGGKVLIIAALLAVVSAIGITRLRVENSFVNYFSSRTEIYQGLRLIDEKLGGTNPLDVIIKFDAEQEYGKLEDDAGVEDEEGFDDLDAMFGDIEMDPADAWFTSFKVDRIKDVHDYLTELPAIGKVLSLASVLRIAEDLNEGEEFDAFELAIINKRMPAEMKSSMIAPYISIDNNEARISMRIKDSLPDLRRKELLDKITHDLQTKFGLSTDEFQVTGLLVLYNNMLQSLFRSQILTLGVVMLGISLMLLILFQSASLAVIGIIPNILAAAIILGLMGLLNIPLDMMTITISAITIGIAVDNSIHYIYRFREEYARRQDYLQTLHYCHANIGRAVFYTAMTIIVGFSILVMSNFIPTIYFGILTALAMFIALLAALTLLPKLILMWKPF